jgi:replicative DNA helicase
MAVEKEILKHLFSDKTNFRVVQDKNLKPAIFIEEEDLDINRLKLLFEISVDYYRTYNDTLSRDSLVRVMQASKASDDNSAKLLAAYDEVSLTATSAPLAFLVDTAKKEYKRAKLRSSLTRAAEMYRANAIEDVAPYMQKEFFDITHDIDELSSEASLSESVDDRTSAYLTAKNVPGVPTGFPTLDKATNGLYPGQIVIIAAGTSEGKSAMLLNVAHNAWAAKANVLYITVENYRPDMMRRFDALHAMVPYNSLKNGTLTDDEKVRLQQALDAQKAHQNIFYVIDKPVECTPDFIEAKINDLMPLKFDILVVDYMQIMDLNTRGKMETHEKMGQIAAELRRIGRIKKLPVITAVQVNREGIKEKSTSYGVQHIALSQFIANHADIILSLRAIDQQQAMASGVVDLECALIKHRDGPKVRFAIKANFERMKMQEQEIRAEEISVVEPPPGQDTLI